MVDGNLVGIFLLGVIVIALYLLLKDLVPYKNPIMKKQNRGCFNCMWRDESGKCYCPASRKKDLVTGKYGGELCSLNVGTKNCKHSYDANNR